MKVAALQLDLAWQDRADNHRRVDAWLPAAQAAGARIVLLPEMFPCGFSMDTAAVTEPEDGPSTAFLQARAQAHALWIGGSIPMAVPHSPAARGGARPANTFVLAGPAGQIHRYRKIHPFSFAREHEHYAAGDRFVTVDVEGLRVTLFVCYDLRFADEFWATAETTDAYLVVANWPARRRRHWTTLLAARAIENQAYVVGVNRVGEGGGLEYAGDSCIVDPWGEVLAGAAGRETMIVAEIDPAVVFAARRDFPVLGDRRRPG